MTAKARSMVAPAPMTRALRHAAMVTVVIGLMVGLMPLVPARAGELLLLAVLTWWAVSVAAVGVVARKRWRHTWPSWVGLLGICMAVLSGIQLELVRILGRRPALTWNVDWRYALSHAQAIARTGDMSRALDYAGAPLNYHVGPAWLAASMARVTGHGMAITLFGLVPLLATAAFAIAAVSLLREHGLQGTLAVGATGVAMTLPGLGAGPRDLVAGLLHPAGAAGLWTFSPGLMLNTWFALAVGMSAMALLLAPAASRRILALGAAGLAATVLLKPPVFVGLGAVAGILGAATLGSGSPRRARGAVFIAALGSLLLAAAFLRWLPHTGQYFGRPVLAPDATGIGIPEARYNAILLLGALLIAMLATRGRRWSTGLRFSRSLLLAAGLAAVVFIAVLAVVLVPVRPDVLQRVHELGNAGYRATSKQAELLQNFLPLHLLIAVAAMAWLASMADELPARVRRLVWTGGGCIALSPLLYMVPAAMRPSRAFEASEETGLRSVLIAVPDDGRLSIASDLADPAEDYLRPLRALDLTAYTGRPFYATSVSYVHYLHPDAPARLLALRTFFGSRWTPWHAQWLQANGIGTVFVNERCRPVWYGQPETGLVVAATSGPWVALTAPMPVASVTAPAATPRWADLVPAFGQAECLRWRLSDRQH